MDQGHRAEFVGMDIKAPTGLDAYYDRLGVDWGYVQHDLNHAPWPFEDASFDLVMARNIALALDPRTYSKTVTEYVRVLKPGGTLEIWEQDFTVRSMRRKIQDKSSRELDMLGVYPVADNSDFAPAINPFIAQVNTWMTEGMAELLLPPMPCSFVEPMFKGHLVEGSENLDVVEGKRVAIPLSFEAMHWEITEDNKPRSLSQDQMMIRRTALESFINMVEAMEPLLRSASRKGESAWDAWFSKAKKDWLEKGGLAFGECLELGVWSVKKAM